MSRDERPTEKGRVSVVPETGTETEVLGPSPEVLSRIENSIAFTKKDKRLRRAAAGALAVLTLFLIAAATAAVVASSKTVEAANQQRLAQDAIKSRIAAEAKVGDATRKAEQQAALAEQANGRRRDAEEQTKVAEKALAAARIKTDEAIAQQQRAESQRNRADLLTKARVTLDTPDPLAAMAPIAQSFRVADGSDARLLLAEAYNDGIPNLLPRTFNQIRLFKVDPMNGNRILLVGSTEQDRKLQNTLALLDLRGSTASVTNDFLYLAATFSPDSRHIYAIAITRYNRGPNEGMDTKIDQEISLLRYDTSLHLEQRTPFDVIQTTSTRRLPGEREQTKWDIRDVQDLTFSPSGNRLIFAGYAAQDYYRNLSNAMPFHLRSWFDFPDLNVHHSIDTEHELSSFNQYRGRVVLLDESHLVVDGISEVYTIDMNTGARVLVGKHTSGVGDLAVNHSGTSITAIGGDNRVTVFQKVPSGWRSIVETLQGDSSCDRIAFFDEDKIAVARGNGSVSLLWISPTFDDESLHLEGELTWRVSREKSVFAHTARIGVITVSPDGRWIATAGEDRTVRVWSPYEYANRVFYGSKRGITGVHFSHDSKQVYVSDADGLLRVFAVEDAHRFTLAVEPGSKRHEEPVPDSAWDEGGGLVQVILREHLGFIRDLTQTATGCLVARTYDRRRTIWDANYHLINTVKTTPETMADVEDRSSAHVTAKVSEEMADLDARDGRRLNINNQWADSTDNLALHLHPLPLPPEPKEKTSAGMFSPDGRWFLLFDYRTQYLRIWDTSSLGRPAASLEMVYGAFRRDDYGTPQSERYLRFSRRGTYVAFPISFDGEALCAIDLRTFTVRVFHADLVPSAFDLSDSGLLVAAGRTGEVYVHNINADKTTVLEKHGRYVASVAISSDGLWVASGSRDRSVRLWASDSNSYYEFKLQNPVERVLFSLDGTELLAAAGRAVYSWYVPIGDDPVAAAHLRTDTSDRSASEKAPRFATQADNLAMLIHRDSPSKLGRVVEASLGREIGQSDSYKSQLLRLLASSEAGHTRVRAAMELASLDPEALKQSLPEIALQLQSESPERDQVVLAVMRLLATIGPMSEVGLRQQLKEAADPALTTGLLYALATLFPDSVLVHDDLRAHLTDHNNSVRVFAAILLSTRGKDSSSVTVLTDAIGSGDPRRQQAADALREYGGEGVPGLIRVFGSEKRFFFGDPKEVARKTLVAIGVPAIPRLITALDTARGPELAEIVRTLAEIGSQAKDAIDPLMKLALAQPSGSGSEVLYALAQVGPDDPRVADLLVNVILVSRARDLDAEFAIRRMAAKTAVPRLRAALERSSAASAGYLADALGSFGEEAAEAIPDLIKLLNTPADIRKTTEALGKIGPAARDARTALLQRLETTSEYDRGYVLEALGKIHPDVELTIPAIIAAIRQQAARSDLRRFRITAKALESMRSGGVAEETVRSLERFDDRIGRMEALFTGLVIREIGPDEWQKYGSEILKAALDSTPHECDEYGVFRNGFGAIGAFGPLARSASRGIADLRALFSGCGDVGRYLEEALTKIDPSTSISVK